jgi:hypothetical protein
MNVYTGGSNIEPLHVRVLTEFITHEAEKNFIYYEYFEKQVLKSTAKSFADDFKFLKRQNFVDYWNMYCRAASLEGKPVTIKSPYH